MVRGQWGNLARMPGLHPYSLLKDILGFLMTTESQDLGLTSHPKDGAFYSIVSPSNVTLSDTQNKSVPSFVLVTVYRLRGPNTDFLK